MHEVARGQQIYARRCAVCHYPASTAKKIGPGLKGLYKRKKFANGSKVTDVGVTRWIESGGRNMPGFRGALKPDEVRDLVAYVKSL